MIQIENKQIVIDRFNSIVKKSINELKNNKKELLANIKNAKRIHRISEFSQIPDLLEVKEYMLQTTPTLASDYSVLEYFSNKEEKEIPQVREAFHNIVSSIKSLTDVDCKDLEKRVKSIDLLIAEYTAYLNGEEYDIKHIFNLIESCGISDEEQIIVLSNIAYNMSVDNAKEESKESDNKYYIAIDEAKEVLGNYYSILWDNTPQEMKDIINVSQIVGSINIYDVLSFYEERIVFAGLLYKIKYLVNDLEEALKNKSGNKEEIYIELNDCLNSLSSISLENVIEYDHKENNVMFLLDKVGNPLFTTDYDQGDLDKLSSLLNKLLSNPGEIANGRLIQDNWLEANRIKAYIKSFSDMNCSYLKMNDGKILIIDFAPNDEIYDESVNIIKRNQDRIAEIMGLVKANDEGFKIMQEAFLNLFENNLNGQNR